MRQIPEFGPYYNRKQMMGAFTFAGVHSSQYNLVCRSVKRPLLPEAKVKRVELPYASGVRYSPSVEYGIRQITMRILYIGDDHFELRSHARLITAWLSSSEFEKLIFDDEPNKYYIAQVSSELDLSTFYESGAVDVIFDCQPFAYSADRRYFNFNGAFKFYNGELLIYNPNVVLEELGGLTGDRILFSSIDGEYPNIAYAVNPGTRELTPSASPVIQPVSFNGTSTALPIEHYSIDTSSDKAGAFSVIAVFGKWRSIKIQHYTVRLEDDPLNTNNSVIRNTMTFYTPGEGALVIDNLRLTITYYPLNYAQKGISKEYNWFNELYNYGEYGTLEQFFTVAPGRNRYKVIVDEEYNDPNTVTVHVAYLPMWL